MAEDSNNRSERSSAGTTKTAAMIHPDRVAPDPTEGWRRGSRGALRKSCDTCTSSKTKCQGSIPCDRCKKRRIDCKFSKRRRCGPKARAEDEKRLRTGMETQLQASLAVKDSPEHKGAVHQQHAGVPRPPSPPLPPISTIAGLDNSSNSMTGGGGGGGLPVSNPKFEGPMTSDSLSGLVELIAPTLSDTGGSGSSASISASINASISSSCHGGGEAAYSHHAAAAAPSGNNRYTPLPGLNAEGVSTFLGGGGTSPPHHNHHHGGGRGGASNRPGFSPSSSVAAVATLSSLSAAIDHTTRQPGGVTRDTLVASRSAPLGGGAGGRASSSTPPSCPVRDLPARAKSMGDTPGGFGEAGGGAGGGGGGVQAGFFPEGSMGNAFMRPQDGGSEARQHASSVGAPLPQQQQHLPPRGPLPMTLDGGSKRHLKTFMRTVGSLILLPGADAIRSVAFGDPGGGGGDPEELPDAPTAAAAAAADRGSAEDGGVKREGRRPVVAAGEDDGIVDVFAEACRAEAWAAAAVGAQFSGASEEECKDYQSRAMRALSRCLDAPLPEVAAVMLLLCLFWVHSMETRKVARYFGFAQQVGLELGSLMPEGLRHTMAFVASLVTMTLNLDQVGSFSLQVKDHALWGVSLRNNSCRPGVDPFVLALTALTVSCNEMLHDGAGRGNQGAIGTGGLSPRVPPSKVLTDLLTKAAKALEADARDGNQNPEHVLALLHGLRGYTHAARGEAEDAEASGRLMLAIIDRHAAILHLPLTFTLAEASRRLLEAGAERSSRPAPEGVHVEALGAAGSKLSFARPTQAVKPGGAGSVAAGGWCAFGDDILAAFAGAGGRDGGGDVLSEAANDNRDRPRSGSMSPPPRRLSRAAFLSQNWQPTTGGGAMPIPISSAGGASSSSSRHAARTADLESSSSLPRWGGVAAGPAGAPPPPPPSSSTTAAHRCASAAAPSDWVDRVRKMPTIGSSSPRASSPNVVHRGGTGGGGGRDVRSPSPRQEDSNSTCTSPRSMGMLHPGPMPSAPPNVGVKYMSEPRDNLGILSRVAAPGGYNNPTPRRASYDDRSGAERQQQAGRQRLGAGQQGGGGGAADRDGGDDPPPANPGLTTGMSFDPNRDDGTFQFTLGPT